LGGEAERLLQRTSFSKTFFFEYFFERSPGLNLALAFVGKNTKGRMSVQLLNLK
jgi:hypothetical protein